MGTIKNHSTKKYYLKRTIIISDFLIAPFVFQFTLLLSNNYEKI